MPAVGVRVLAAFLLGACLLSCAFSRGPCTKVGIWPCCATVAFDLRQVLATVPGDVQVGACVDEKCVQPTKSMSPLGSSTGTMASNAHLVQFGWAYDGFTFFVHQAAVDDPQVDLRLIVRDHGRVVFDATRMLRLYEGSINGPGCSPTEVGGTVLATPEGDLILQ
jgi:hypothetical protein